MTHPHWPRGEKKNSNKKGGKSFLSWNNSLSNKRTIETRMLKVGYFEWVLRPVDPARGCTLQHHLLLHVYFLVPHEYEYTEKVPIVPLSHLPNSCTLSVFKYLLQCVVQWMFLLSIEPLLGCIKVFTRVKLSTVQQPRSYVVKCCINARFYKKTSKRITNSEYFLKLPPRNY